MRRVRNLRGGYRSWRGGEFTTLKDRKKEIGRDLLAKMCRDLNIDPHDL